MCSDWPRRRPPNWVDPVWSSAPTSSRTATVGAGYGVPTPGSIEAIRMVANLEGILLDPVYSGKGMAGLVDLVRKGHSTKGQHLVFCIPAARRALFGYGAAFA